MPVVNHVLIHTVGGGTTVVNGITSMLLAIDDAVDTTVALIRARGVTVAAANGVVLPPGYFDTSRALTVYATAGEFSLFAGTPLEAVT